MTPPQLLALAGFHSPAPPIIRQLVPGACVFVGAQLTSVAAYYNGNTYVGLIDGNGNVRVAQVNVATGAVTLSPPIATFASPDQHSAPGVLIRASDHRIVIVACDVGITSGLHVWRAISTNPEDVSSWGAAVEITSSLTGSPYTYSMLQQLAAESGKVYLFYQGGFPPTAADLYVATSTDGGATFGGATLLFSNGANSCYWAITSDDTQRIDFAVSSGAVVDGQTGSLYHFYYDGAYRKSDGTALGAPPFVPANLTKVYDGPTNGNVRTPYAITQPGPTIVWSAGAVSNPLTTALNYWWSSYAAGWSPHLIVDAGVTPPPSNYWEGGIMIDPADSSHVILGRAGELLSYRTPDGGVTWHNDLAITSDGAFGPNLRPFAPHNADSSLLAVSTFGPWPQEITGMIGAQIRGYPA